MKTKLLKKVRKRFEIICMPNGILDSDGYKYDYHLYKLEDSTNHFRERWCQLGRKEGPQQWTTDNNIFDTEKECINHLTSTIIQILRAEGYRGRKDAHVKNTQLKVWYN